MGDPVPARDAGRLGARERATRIDWIRVVKWFVVAVLAVWLLHLAVSAP